MCQNKATEILEMTRNAEGVSDNGITYEMYKKLFYWSKTFDQLLRVLRQNITEVLIGFNLPNYSSLSIIG